MQKQKFEPELEEYLSLKSESTQEIYASTYRKFLAFYQNKYGEGKGFAHFLDQIYKEFQKPPREQKRIIEMELSDFINHLKEDKKSNNTIRLYVASIQNFLKFKNITVSFQFIGNMPPPVEKKENGKHEWKLEQIKQFVDKATSYRDKALILCMFQSGLAVNEICMLNYGDIQEEFEGGVSPICLKLVRKKTAVEFKSFFGRDAVKYLRLYLATRNDLNPDSPLFTKQRARGGEVRISTAAIIQSFSEIAKELPFIKQKGGYNPARPHSLRAGFNSQLIGKIDATLREFWMGHTIGGVARAYLNMPTEELRKLYMTAEQYLKIETTSRDELDEQAKEVKLPPEVGEKIKILSSEVENLRDELAKSKATVSEVYEFVHRNFDPLLAFVDTISELPEFEQMKRKLLEAKDAKARAEVEGEQEHNLRFC